MRSTIARVFLLLCVTATGCAIGSQRGNTDKAINHFKQGRDLYREGDLDGAIAEYRTALPLDPAHFSAHYNLGTALHAQGKRIGTKEEPPEVRRLLPDTPADQTDIGVARQQLRELK